MKQQGQGARFNERTTQNLPSNCNYKHYPSPGPSGAPRSGSRQRDQLVAMPT